MSDGVTKKIDLFFTNFKHQTYKKGEILIRADDDPTGIFYLTKGIVKEYAISKKGDELVLNLFNPVSFFPMSWAINGSHNTFFYEAVTDLEIWKAPGESVVAFVKENPDVLYDLLSRVYRGTDGMLNRMTYLMTGNAHSRIIVELIISAKRFGKKTTDSIEIEISEKDIAAQSGMTRETVSRELKILKDKGLVTFSRNSLKVIDLQMLEDELMDGV